MYTELKTPQEAFDAEKNGLCIESFWPRDDRGWTRVSGLDSIGLLRIEYMMKAGAKYRAINLKS